ncbi:uncharacterized protein [Apostichopus japonicus]|uniref:uncharacterized protein isoform X2 n=1 Tax=Stichopus japonicus TaxID=307972 RepID=UPI003AB3C945
MRLTVVTFACLLMCDNFMATHVTGVCQFELYKQSVHLQGGYFEEDTESSPKAATLKSYHIYNLQRDELQHAVSSTDATSSPPTVKTHETTDRITDQTSNPTTLDTHGTSDHNTDKPSNPTTVQDNYQTGDHTTDVAFNPSTEKTTYKSTDHSTDSTSNPTTIETDRSTQQTTVPTTPISCPLNTVWSNCTCQTTCDDPTEVYGCFNSCGSGETCLCPDGFFLSGEDCVTDNQCGCYHATAGVIPNGESYLDTTCSNICSCEDNVLSCNGYSCSATATCRTEGNGSKCMCNDGFMGDGATCERVKDCWDVYNNVSTDEGLHHIYPSAWPLSSFEVYCKEGWTLIQKRMDGSIDFNSDWDSYKNGFGNLDGEFWLGNEKIHTITTQQNYEIKIDFTITVLNAAVFLQYDLFRISTEADDYKLIDLGDQTGSFDFFNFMEYHRDQSFTTYDRDNDASSSNCAVKHTGGWWHKVCYSSNFNGLYGDDWDVGICIVNKNTRIHDCNIKTVEMKIRPV